MATRRTTNCLLLIAAIVTVTIGSISLTAQNPVGLWKLNEGSGDRAFDSSGGNRTASLSNGIHWTNVAGTWALSGSAARKGYVTIPATDLSATNAVSVAFWVKRTYTTNGDSVLFEAGKTYLGSETGFALLPDDEACHGIQAVLRGNEGTTANCYAQPSSGVWHHFAIVYDKSQTGGNAVAFYVDGALQNPSWNLASATNTNNFGNDPIYLLSRGGASQFSTGTISDFRIYDSPLTAEQVQKVYDGSQQMGSAPSGLVAAYSFNEGSGSTVTDASGNGNNGTISNATWTNAGKYGKALVFNGGNSIVTVSDASSLHLTSTMTLEAWVDPSVVNSAWRDVIYKGNDNYFMEGTSTRSAVPGAGATLGGSNVLTYGTAALSTNTWTHLAVSYDGSTLRFFVNGIQVSSVAKTGNIANSTNPLQIGGDSIFGQYFSGIIDEIRIYSTALTQSQIQSDMITPIGASLVSISVTPVNPSIAVGGRQPFTATGTYSDGSHQDLTSSVSWTSSVPSVATISSTGLASGIAAGTTTIKATSGTIFGSTSLTVTSTANFTIGASPTSLTIQPGTQGIATITTAVSGGFNGAIALSASGAPSGTSITFNPGTIPAPGSGTSTMTITVGSSTPLGTYPVTVTGTGGGIHQTVAVTLTVTGSTATIAYVQGNYATPQSPQTTVSVVYSVAQTAGDLNVVVVGWNDSTATLSSIRDTKGNVYSVAVGPTIQSGYASQSIYYAKNIVAAAAGANTVTVTFSRAAVAPDIRILEYSGVDPNTPVDVTAASSGSSQSSSSGSVTTTNARDLILGANLVQTLTSGAGTGFTKRLMTVPDGDIAEDQMVTTTGSYSASASVSPSGPWIMQMVAFRAAGSGSNFALSSSPSSLTIAQGNQSASTITAAISGGFNSSISLSASGAPSGTTVTFNPTSIPAPGSGSSTMTIAVGSGTAAGTYPITVTGNGAGIQRSTTVTLTVTGGASFSISASPATLSVMQGMQGTSTITTAISGGFNSSISISASGMPTGTTVTFNPAAIPAPGSGSSTMTIVVGAATPMGTYPITVTGTGQGLHQTATVTLTVTAQVGLSWSASQSPGIAGYNVYRSMTSGGPYTKINGGLQTTTTYDDHAVQDGYTYYYVTTAVDQSGNESSYSNQASALVP